MRSGGLMNRIVRIGELRRRVDEDAAAEIRRREPLMHHFEQPEELRPRIVARHLAHRAVPRLRFPRIALAHRLLHQVVLAFEVLVERRLRHADFSEDLIKADGVEAVRIEQIDGGVDEPLAATLADVRHAQQLRGGFVSEAFGHVATA